MVVTPTKLTLMDPFHRALTQSTCGGCRAPHYSKTRALTIPCQSNSRNGHLSVPAAPVRTQGAPPAVRKMGVASLLFHRTLSPKDTLQVHSYTLESQRRPPTQLQVHSYAREHQARHLQHKTCTPSQVQQVSAASSCEATEPRPEGAEMLTNVVKKEPDARSPSVQKQGEAAEEDTPTDQLPRKPDPSTAQTQLPHKTKTQAFRAHNQQVSGHVSLLPLVSSDWSELVR